jgi:hypothetical protein
MTSMAWNGSRTRLGGSSQFNLSGFVPHNILANPSAKTGKEGDSAAQIVKDAVDLEGRVQEAHEETTIEHEDCSNEMFKKVVDVEGPVQVAHDEKATRETSHDETTRRETPPNEMTSREKSQAELPLLQV